MGARAEESNPQPHHTPTPPINTYTIIFTPSQMRAFHVFGCGHATLYEALSVGPHKLKCEKYTIWMCFFMGVGGGAWGVDGGWMPLPTRLH